MPIDINGAGNNQLQNTRTERQEVNVRRNESPVSEDETGSSQTRETVSLGNASSQIRSIENTLASLPVVDTQRVEAFRQLIADGTYNVDANSIADKLINLEQSLNE